MKTPNLLYLLSFIMIWISSCGPRESKDNRPNIIFIMVDDMGYADLSSYGRTDYQTPVIDAFIDEGMKFTQAYAAQAICTPTRVALMTGRYPARNEVGLIEPLELSDSIGLSPEIETLSSLIKSSGYETALFGKWHLGSRPEFLPNRHGYDQFFGISPGAADYIDHKYFSDEPILYENDKLVDKEGYLTDLITDYTVNFIKQRHDKPFFINLEYTAPHWPWQQPGDDPYPYGKSFADFRVGGTPEVYAGMIKNLDMNIGRVLQALKETGLDNSTIIIFTSDNGGEKFSDMGPLQGEKGNLYEGGIRVPAAVRWPGKINTGTISDQVVVTMDWTVTMLQLAEVTIPEGVSFDGINLLSVLQGDVSTTPRTLFWRIGKQGANNLQNAYRDGDWKYLKTNEEEFLFDLKTDIGESNNLKDVNPEVFNRLKKEFEELDNQMLERLPIE